MSPCVGYVPPFTRTVLGLGSAALTVWPKLEGALEELSQIRTFRVSVGDFLGRVQDVSDYVDIDSVHDDRHLDTARRRLRGEGPGAFAGAGFSPWLLLASEGFELHLNTAQETAKIIAKARQAQLAEQAEATAAKAARSRDRHPLLAS